MAQKSSQGPSQVWPTHNFPFLFSFLWIAMWLSVSYYSLRRCKMFVTNSNTMVCMLCCYQLWPPAMPYPVHWHFLLLNFFTLHMCKKCLFICFSFEPMFSVKLMIYFQHFLCLNNNIQLFFVIVLSLTVMFCSPWSMCSKKLLPVSPMLLSYLRILKYYALLRK